MTNTPLILLVEDSPDDAYFFQRALARTGIGCPCQHVLNGREAVRALVEAHRQSTLPIAVFLDLKMPVMNGFEVLEWIRQQPFTSEVPVYVLSGSNQHEDRERARLLGACNYLVKPMESAALAAILASKITSSREVSV